MPICLSAVIYKMIFKRIKMGIPIEMKMLIRNSQTRNICQKNASHTYRQMEIHLCKNMPIRIIQIKFITAYIYTSYKCTNFSKEFQSENCS